MIYSNGIAPAGYHKEFIFVAKANKLQQPAFDTSSSVHWRSRLILPITCGDWRLTSFYPFPIYCGRSPSSPHTALRRPVPLPLPTPHPRSPAGFLLERSMKVANLPSLCQVLFALSAFFADFRISRKSHHGAPNPFFLARKGTYLESESLSTGFRIFPANPRRFSKVAQKGLIYQKGQ